jgi:hypothetical protein
LAEERGQPYPATKRRPITVIPDVQGLQQTKPATPQVVSESEVSFDQLGKN